MEDQIRIRPEPSWSLDGALTLAKIRYIESKFLRLIWVLGNVRKFLTPVFEKYFGIFDILLSAINWAKNEKRLKNNFKKHIEISSSARIWQKIKI